MATVPVTDDKFSELLKSDKPVLVDFWATWCGPCRMMAPVLEEFSAEHADKVTVAKMDVDANPQTPGKYNIMSIPTMILFKDGKVAQQLVGYMPKAELASRLAEHL